MRDAFATTDKRIPSKNASSGRSVEARVQRSQHRCLLVRMILSALREDENANNEKQRKQQPNAGSHSLR